MGPISVKDTRRQLKILLDRVEAGETIAIARRGAVIAKLAPADTRPKRLSSLANLRHTIRAKGRPLSALVQEARGRPRVTTYVDTSVLAAYYCPEPLSILAERTLRRLSSPMSAT